MPPIVLDAPDVVTSINDGEFSGLHMGRGQPRPPGEICSYAATRAFYGVPAVTARTADRILVAPVNKRIVYVNGIGTTSATHAYTVKLISIITGANVIGIYNQSGDGEDTNLFFDLIQCLGDKTGLSNNPATNTLARSAFKACTDSMYLNVVAHSQGAIISSRAMRQTIGMLLDFYGRRDAVVRPLLEEVDSILNAGMLSRLLSGAFRQIADSIKIVQLRNALTERILPTVEEKLGTYVSIQTFGGAARFYPDGPRYRHVYNFWDPVPMLVGQGDILTGPGRGARVEQIDRNAGMRIRDIADHSITDLYMQSSEHFVDRNGNMVDRAYIPIDMSMVRS